jgi:hypothetical protein
MVILSKIRWAGAEDWLILQIAGTDRRTGTWCIARGAQTAAILKRWSSCSNEFQRVAASIDVRRVQGAAAQNNAQNEHCRAFRHAIPNT